MTEAEIPVHPHGLAEAVQGQHRLAPCYLGHRTRSGCAVVVMPRGVALAPRLDVWNHSPTGFAWGYGGSGPAQLALALLCDALSGDTNRAVELHQSLKWQVIARITIESWLIFREDLLVWVDREERTGGQ